MPQLLLVLLWLALPALSPAERQARARLAAHRRWHGDDADLSDDPDVVALEQATTAKHIAEVVARAGRMSAEQRALLRRVFKYGPPEQ
jgi:hypothetical protein